MAAATQRSHEGNTHLNRRVLVQEVVHPRVMEQIVSCRDDIAQQYLMQARQPRHCSSLCHACSLPHSRCVIQVTWHEP